MKWRVNKMCSDCPFAAEGPGLHLRLTLGRKRWAGILNDLRRQGHFLCHQTTEATGKSRNLVCAGALDWQEKHGLSSQYARIAERLATHFGEQVK